MKSSFATIVVAFALALSAADARSALIAIGPGSFTPQASVITFSESEQPLGTINPTYNLTTASLGTVNVSFDSNFVGQTVTGVTVRTITGTPTGPLTLDPSNDNHTFTTLDNANPTSPVLSGTPTFNGPISVLFSVPVAAVGLDGGFFNAIGGTTIEAYAADGTVLGSVTNTALGIEFFGLADSSGLNVISGISFYITGSEPAGFAIDNLTFGSRGEVNPPGVIPEAASFVTWAVLGLMGCVVAWRKRYGE